MQPFIFPLRIYIEDTDCVGIVYHSNYLNYFERARSEQAEHLGFGIAWQRENNIYFTICYANINYLKPARVWEEVEVVTTITRAKGASLIYDQYLRLASVPDSILCKAEIKVACVDTQFKPQALPGRILDLFTRRKL